MSDDAQKTALRKLADTIRRAAKPGTWSAAVKLAREDAVLVESSNEDEIVARVRSPGRPVAPSAVLVPGEREWDCDCGSRVSPCEHVAAAAIVLARLDEGAAEAGVAPARTADATSSEAPRPARAPSWGRVLYRFTRDESGTGLRLARAIRYHDGREVALPTTLSALLSRPVDAAGVSPEQADLRADQLLGTASRAALAPTKLDALLRVLVGCERVLLDGAPVAIAEGELAPRARVEDRGDDVVLTIEAAPEIRAVVSAGVALVADAGAPDALALQRLGETDLSGPWLQHLPQVRVTAPRDLGGLAATVLPDLARRIEVDVRSARVPTLVRGVAPRLVLDLSHAGDGLSVLPTLVYGAPPFARVDDGAQPGQSGQLGKLALLGRSRQAPVRDPAAERALVLKLREDLDLVPGRRTSYAGADAPRFAEKLRRWRGGLTGEAARVVSETKRLEPRLRLASAPAADGGPPIVTFDLRFDVIGKSGAAAGGEGATVDAEAVVRAWREGLGLVPLLGGGWAELPRTWLDAHGERVADLLAARDAAGRLAPHALPRLGPLCDDLNQPRPAGLERLEPLFGAFEKLPEPPLPADLVATLRPYQRQGVAWLSFLRGARLGGVLADDMGLGKTLQALCVAGPGTLVVCPTSVLHNWAAEARRFRPNLRVSVYHGPDRELDPKADVTITSYALLRLDAAALSAKTWRAVFLDEAQAIKNPESQVARAAFGLDAEFRLALSGTPVENRLDELWSLMHFANRGLLGGRGDFDARTARPIAAGDGDAAAKLRARIRPFVLRRLKRDVAPELPPRTEAVLRVALDERERAVYDAVRAAAQKEVVALLESSGGVMRALEALLRMRQAASHAALVPGQTAATSSKVEALVEALGSAAADGHKALVFSQWTSFLDLVEPHLPRAGLRFSRLDGSTRDRAAVVNQFQSDDGPPVLLVSLKAGGTGLNLTAADHVFLCDLWWNPAVEDQAADRAHRIGQDKPVTVYRLVALDTVEERILALQEQKRALVDTALGDAAGAAALTRDDLLALLA
ncbi:MAG TPA: DEAD/DEAH box helicase [Polyangia bacterium]|nr:DEAD/DEAH box helicase [Polyangia bacterium]